MTTVLNKLFRIWQLHSMFLPPNMLIFQYMWDVWNTKQLLINTVKEP